MHDSVRAFAREQLSRPYHSAIEAGSLDVNGSLRSTVVASSYIGFDLQPGPGVDLVANAAEPPFPSQSADLVICAEMLEHALHWQAALSGVKSLVSFGGALLLTTRSPGFPYHPYPDDYWRFTPALLWGCLPEFEIHTLISDPQVEHPGVFVFASRVTEELISVPATLEAFPV